MRETGIVRRIDDLGRIIIPKDVRRKLCIHEGDPFEICIDGDNVVFKPYRVVDELMPAIDKFEEAVKYNYDLKYKDELIGAIAILKTVLRKEVDYADNAQD